METDRRSAHASPDRLERILGSAVVAVWGRLPQDVQHDLFEEAVLAGHRSERRAGEPDEGLRESLAIFLHDHHFRTADA
ncbi:hypothetical protein PQJ75_21505 [Rhodoplanes sp. TEM]|uniref:Uncharacterized protein n=1 Tax=Rhodoplanes tepidamans TaxID=200616 RepID=A0ABT5JBT7_RHOTP|nr:MULTISPECIES: hypothetical protein [Rhodoplanes]MDC7787094.1 hypothetical protein [Rhodoplanes tepidamans]MDC7986313.1 hypothetical protein [Rhodoplanes sp. TEM]MDQ0358694.1 hypothetical protein [Rhodoplanes tepidamans]